MAKEMNKCPKCKAYGCLVPLGNGRYHCMACGRTSKDR
jgi:hypothetical protein